MMRAAIITIFALITLSACDSDQERMIKAKEKYIRETIQTDWRNGIPLDALVNVHNMCQQYHDLRNCEIAQQQMDDLAASYASCYSDQRSKLCLALIRDIGAHPILTLLPKSQALKLSAHPGYWELPTLALEALSSRFEYRREAATWWWQAWGSYILSCIALLAMSYGGWFWRSGIKNGNQQRAAALARQREALIAQEKSRRLREEKERAETAELADLEREAVIEEQERIKSEALAEQERQAVEQQAAAKAAKEAEEQNEAARLLEIEFAPSKPKRRKRVPSSK